MRRTSKGRLELAWRGKDSALIPVEDGTCDYAWTDPSDDARWDADIEKPGDKVATGCSMGTDRYDVGNERRSGLIVRI